MGRYGGMVREIERLVAALKSNGQLEKILMAKKRKPKC